MTRAPRHAARVQGIGRARVPRRQASREQLEHLEDRRGHRHAAQQPVQEARAVRHQAGRRRIRRQQQEDSEAEEGRSKPGRRRSAAADQTIGRLDEPRRGESRGGKSELRRAVRRVTPGQGNLKESGTENIPPRLALRASSRQALITSELACARPESERRVRVKRCGKSAPRSWQHGWQAKPRTEQGQIGRRSRTARPKPPGRPLDPVSNGGARGMVVTPARATTEFGLRPAAAAFFGGRHRVRSFFLCCKRGSHDPRPTVRVRVR